MKFELHTHTCYSAGKHIHSEAFERPAAVVRRAKEIGLDAIAITDHNTIKALPEAEKEARKQGIIFIPGEEVETSKGTHIIALGISEMVRPGLSAKETIDRIREQGAVAIAVHPFDIRGMGLQNDFVMADAVESFNSINLDRFSNMIAAKKARDKEFPSVAGSDAHSLDMIGRAVNISGAGDLDSILRDIRKGNVVKKTTYIPLDVIMEWARLRLLACYEEAMDYINMRFGEPLAGFLRFMASRYRYSDGGWWRYLARASLGASYVYSGIKIFHYY